MGKTAKNLLVTRAREVYYQKMVLFMVSWLFIARFSGADIIEMKDGKEKTGVILRSDEDSIILATYTEDEKIETEKIRKIILGRDNDNLIFLADRALRDGEKETAYYLYTKVFWSDPDNEAAIRGITRLDPEVKSDKEAQKWLASYERYQTKAAGATDKEILSGDSSRTEDLLKKIGVTMISESGRIKVTEVVAGSRAGRGGLEINDFLMEIDGRSAVYMGLFDAVTVMLDVAADPVLLEVEREIRQWVGKAPDGFKIAVSGPLSSQDGKNNVFIITGGKDLSLSEGKGAVGGDILVAVNGVKVAGSLSLQEAENLIERTGPNEISIVIRRKITI